MRKLILLLILLFLNGWAKVGEKFYETSEKKLEPQKVAVVKDIKLLKSLEGHKGGVLSVSFSPDGRFLASGSRDNTIKIWEVERE